MEKHSLECSGPQRSLAVFSLASCLCGDEYEDMENEESQLSRLFPTISISPILLRPFAPVTRYLTTRGPVPDTGNQQLTVQIEEKHIPPPQMLRLHRRSYARLMEYKSTTYTYNRLKDGEIRVILLEEASFSDDIVIRLEVRKRTAVHRYEAVSYAWGHGQETAVIKVRDQSGTNGCAELQVRENVVTMLRHLRARQHLEPLWIDAICINQGRTKDRSSREDRAVKVEKAVQVRQMGDVYQRAVRTLVWLGHTKETLLFNLDQAWPYKNSINTVKLHVEPLSKNLYFTRRWVIQELSLSRKILLLDRHSEIDFRVLQEASEFILNHIHHLDRVKDWRLLNALHLMHILRELDSESTGVRTTCVHDFLRLLVSAHISDCENGLDRIYALGALEKAKRIPDYNAKVEQLFEDFAKEECQRSLETLYCSGAFPDTYTSKKTKGTPLPSWVPDWRSTRMCIPISLMHGQKVSESSFGTSMRDLKFRPKFPWHVSSNTLVVRGALIGEVKSAECISTISGLLKFYSRSEAGEDVNLLIRMLTLDAVRDGEIARSWLKVYRDSNGETCPLENHKFDCDHLDSEALYKCNTLRRIEDVMTGRCALVTKGGHWAVGPYRSQEGDYMVQLDGCRFPFVMRRQAGDTWRIIGDCYTAPKVGEAHNLTQELRIM